jgi:hypothetical protein
MVNGVTCLFVGGGVIWGQTFHIIVGTPGIRLPINSDVYIPVFVYTNSTVDSIANFSIALATKDQYITTRYRPADSMTFGNFFGPPINSWVEHWIQPSATSNPISGWKNQTYWGIGFSNYVCPSETTLFCIYKMRTTSNPGVIGVTDSIFAIGHDNITGDTSLGDPFGCVYEGYHMTYHPVTFVAQWDSAQTGTGITVLNKFSGHIDTKWDPSQSKFSLKDVSRRLNYNPHYHYGHMKDTASVSIYYANGNNYPGNMLYDIDNCWVADSQKEATDAQVNAGLVYDYMLNHLNRNGFDTAGSSFISTVHDANLNNNASWDPNRRQVKYGTVSGLEKPKSGAIDIVAHEWGHGIKQFTSGIPPSTIGEPRALTESFSDMFGAVVGFATNDPDWLHGEDVSQSTFRNLNNPLASIPHQPDTYLGQYWDIIGAPYINMGVPNKMFYLLSEGGAHRGITVQGIGIVNAFQVMYTASKLRWLDTTSFKDAKRRSVAVAESVIANQNWAVQTAAAWNAVGVCPYAPGDVNCNGECRGSDLTYLVGFFGGSVSVKPNCICTDLNNLYIAFWVSADYNDDCLITGADVTYGVRYFKGLGPAPDPCNAFPTN